MFAAPAIIAIDRLMPVKAFAEPIFLSPMFKTPYGIIAPYKGGNVLDVAFFYCPYIPLQV